MLKLSWMSNALDQVYARAKQLPEDEQESLAAILQAELESDAKWSALFAKHEDKLVELADKALEEHRAGRSRPMFDE